MKWLELDANSTCLPRKIDWKYFKKFHLPKTQFQLLDGRFMPLLPYKWLRSKVRKHWGRFRNWVSFLPLWDCTVSAIGNTFNLWKEKNKKTKAPPIKNNYPHPLTDIHTEPGPQCRGGEWSWLSIHHVSFLPSSNYKSPATSLPLFLGGLRLLKSRILKCTFAKCL